MKILIDTNVVLDFALQRQPYFDESEQILSLAEQNQFEGYVSASTFSDLYYLIRKAKGRDLALDFLRRLATICQISAVNEAAISMAIASKFRDFEDAIQHSAAVINHLDGIVTRNTQDFTNGTVRIFTPSQLLVQLGIGK